jgi:hypothetical protein
MKKYITIAAIFMIIIGMQTNADAILFDPTGSGSTTGAIDIAQWDWGPAPALAVDGGGDPLVVGDTFTLLTHGLLNAVAGPDAGDLTDSLPAGAEITFVAGFVEEVISASSDGVSSSAVFTATGTGTNFFEVFIDFEPDADLDIGDDGSAGTGFNDGTPLFSGTITGGLGNFSSIFTDPVLLDNFTGDDTSGATGFSDPQQTVTGTGGTTINTTVLFSNFNPNYFPEVTSPLAYLFNTNTSNNLPFFQVDPANNFWDGSAYIPPQVGAINGAPGFGPNTTFQADASTSEIGTSEIPEPSTIILLGFGLLGVVGFGRKKFKK